MQSLRNNRACTVRHVHQRGKVPSECYERGGVSPLGALPAGEVPLRVPLPSQHRTPRGYFLSPHSPASGNGTYFFANGTELPVVDKLLLASS